VRVLRCKRMKCEEFGDTKRSEYRDANDHGLWEAWAAGPSPLELRARSSSVRSHSLE
jgi:hypothetical protein